MKRWKEMCKKIFVLMFSFLLFCVCITDVRAAKEETFAVEFVEEGIQLETNIPDGDDAVRLYTYTIYEDNKKVGTLELRYGVNTSGEQLWITTDSKAVEIERYQEYFEVNSNYLTVKTETWESYFAGDEYTYSVQEDVLPEIPAPEKVVWNKTEKTGMIEWSFVEEAVNGYAVALFLDGEKQVNMHFNSNRYGKYDFSFEMNDSGAYTVEVIAVGDKTTGDSKKTVSKVYNYNKPDESVEQAEMVWWTAKDGEKLPTVINWNPVPGAAGYEVCLYGYENGEKVSRFYRKSIYNTENKLVTSQDWTDAIQRMNTEYGSTLSYISSVRALAGDIEVVANASKADRTESGEYVTSTIVKEIEDILNDAEGDEIFGVVEDMGIESVATAMQSDDDVLERVAELEEELIEQYNIQVKTPIVTHPKIDKSKIEIVGAGVNAAAVTGSSIRLEFDSVAKGAEKKIKEELYKNAVQVSISLKHGEEDVTGTLACPITITMRPPMTANLDKLVILHYHADGEMETIYPAKNADGTITFSVTSFSTFVFAELVTYTDAGIADNEENDSVDDKGNTGSDNYDDSYSDSDDDDDDNYEKVNPVLPTTGVKIVGTARKYMKTDGKYAVNEWILHGNTWYLAGADGNLISGWYQNMAGTWYYLDTDCRMKTGWLQDTDGTWYYLDLKNGDMKRGWSQDTDGKWYYLDLVNGGMKTGWLQDVDGKWYYLNSSGDMKIGWLEDINGKWYYLGGDGACWINTITPDGYVVNENGEWVE